MAEQKPVPTCEEQIEKDFRKKNLWHSFMQGTYGALSIAAYMGALGTLATGLITAATTASAPVVAGVAVAGSIFAPLPMLVIGGLLAVGTICSYMSQVEGTELKCLQDEHMAQQNAMKLTPGLAVSQSASVDHPKNQRADGKKWQEVVSNPQPQVSQQVH